MTDNVVFLKFRSEKVDQDGRDFLACTHCRNKTFTAIYQGGESFPLMQCAACGSHIGKIGWASDG